MTACIDISDGLGADLQHLLDAHGLAAELALASVPRAPGFAARCRRLGIDPESTLLGSGGDYELLFTVRGASPSTASLSRRLGVPVSEIGRVVSGGKGSGPPPARGWRHF